MNDRQSQSYWKKLFQESQTKYCLFPTKEKCQLPVIKAHSIQNNRILSRLSENGKVITLTPSFQEDSIIFEEVGRGIATTFKGLCSKHDQVFSKIEDVKYYNAPEQNFLFAFRAFLFEFWRSQIRERFALKMLFSTFSDEVLGEYESARITCSSNTIDKFFFDKAIINSDYGEISSYVRTLPHKLNIAVCSAFPLAYDLKGKPVNSFSLHSKERLKNVYLNIFPGDIESFIVICWLKEDDEIYSPIINDISILSNDGFDTVMNNLLPYYCENIVINPLFWKNLTKIQKDDYISKFNLTIPKINLSLKKNLHTKSSYNLLLP